MLTAKDAEIDKIVGLELGADDYITKPFSVRELMARVKANLRKNEISTIIKETEQEMPKMEEITDSIIRVNDLELDLDRFEVKVRGKIIDLTLREFEVLKFLAAQPGQVITRETLLEKVWGYEYYGDIRTVDVTVRRIREKIEKRHFKSKNPNNKKRRWVLYSNKIKKIERIKKAKIAKIFFLFFIF